MGHNPNQPASARVGEVAIASSFETWFLAVQNWRGFQGRWLAPGEPPVEKHAQQGLPGGRVRRAVSFS